MKPWIAWAAALVLAFSPAFAQKDETSRKWNQPVEPYRVIGNIHFVGAADIASFLIATPEGHILLDGGFEETVPIIRAGVEKLGFKLSDVKVLLNSHAHYDHAGGLAELKKLTGATLWASEGDAPALAKGGRDDFRFGDTLAFPPVQPDRTFRDGGKITIGGVTLTARITPGHTQGNTTWTLKVEEGGKTYDVVIVGSASILPGDVLTNNPKYPGLDQDYATTLRVLASLPCDVFLASHPNFYGGLGKAERLRKGEAPNPFIDPAGYRKYVERSEARYKEWIAKEKATRPDLTP